MKTQTTELTVQDFADIFGTTAENIPPKCTDVIKASDFRYQVLSGADRDSVILRVVKTLMSDTLKITGPHRKPDWEKGWSENFDSFMSNGHNTKELIPKFVRKNEIARFKGEYIMPVDPEFETNFVKVLRYYLFFAYFAVPSKVFEFGCGTGLNLVALSELYPEKRSCGLDWSETSCRIVNELSTRLNLNMRGVLFDMFSPNYAIEVDNDSAVFTLGAMEQLGSNFMPFVDFLIKKGPAIVINVEVDYELHDQNLLFEYLSAAYMEKRNYLRGFSTHLQELERTGTVDILDRRKTFGTLFHDGYAYIVWKPTRQGTKQ